MKEYHQLLFLLLLLSCIWTISLGKSSAFNDHNRINKNSFVDFDDDKVETNVVGLKGGNEKKETKRNQKRKIIIPVKREPLLSRALSAAKSVQSSLKDTEEKMKFTWKTINRSVKSYFSSDFESLLLRLTSPDDFQPSDKDISSFISLIKSYSPYKNMVSEHNPYRVTLRKLWQKMIEPDYRSVIKALCLFHLLLKLSDYSDAKVYQKFLLKMSKETHDKSNGKYFNLKTFQKNLNSLKEDETEVLEEQVNEGNKDFISKYFLFLWKRSVLFTSNFHEMKEIHYQKQVEYICSTVSPSLYPSIYHILFFPFFNSHCYLS
jgi:hypothetical protein